MASSTACMYFKADGAPEATQLYADPTSGKYDLRWLRLEWFTAQLNGKRGLVNDSGFTHHDHVALTGILGAAGTTPETAIVISGEPAAAAPTAEQHIAKRARTEDDATSIYMRELLEPPLEKPPPFAELPVFMMSDLKKKLVCQDSDYNAASAKEPRAKEVLIPQSQEPTAQALARIVSNVLNTGLRNVQGEDTLHKDVDMVFVDMFNLAASAGLLTFDYGRNTSDIRSGTTGAGLRPDFLLWVEKALLFKGEEKRSADELDQAEDEIMAKMTSTWDETVYGECMYMFAYAVAGYMLKIYSIQHGQRLLLLKADMRTLRGKLDVLVAVVNMTRALCAMSKSLPVIAWGVGQQVTVQQDGKLISRVTNMGDYVRKELKDFDTYHSKYATREFLHSSYRAIADAAQAGGATHLMRAKKLPKLTGKDVSIMTVPVGVAYSNNSMPCTEQEAKLAVRGAVEGCGELHALNIAHRDPRWPNIIKVLEGGEASFKLIDIEKSGVLGAPCTGAPYPLPHWEYHDGTGRTVLEPDGTYSARSDFKMIGKALMAGLQCLGAAGQDLRDRLENGEYQSATEVLAHEWFQ